MMFLFIQDSEMMILILVELVFGTEGSIMECLSDKQIKAGAPNQLYFQDLESVKVLECQIQ